MSYALIKDGRVVATKGEAWECVAEILARKWHLPIERYGVVWIRGVEVREVEQKKQENANVVGTSTD